MFEKNIDSNRALYGNHFDEFHSALKDAVQQQAASAFGKKVAVAVGLGALGGAGLGAGAHIVKEFLK